MDKDRMAGSQLPTSKDNPTAEETVVGIYDQAPRAEAAIAELHAAGIPERAISVHTESAVGPQGGAPGTGPSRGDGFWAGLLGGESEQHAAAYERSLQNGSVVVTVRAPAGHVDRVMEILEHHNPLDVDEPNAADLAQSASGRETLQLAEEQLQIGKRVTTRGGTRIRRFVVETPVEQTVSLHSEQVRLERHPVTDGRPVTDSFSEKTLELTETAEEAVVSKTARIYEEVGLRKEATDRVETVRDTVRKEQVEVEQIPAADRTSRAPRV